MLCWCYLAITVSLEHVFFGEKSRYWTVHCIRIYFSESEELKRFIHFADDYLLNTNDKFAKVTQLYDIANKNLKQSGFLHLHYSVDEQMVPYTGKNSSKQTIRKKTILFGQKNFVIFSDDGYPYFIDPYCRAKEKRLKIFLLGQ